MTEKATPNWTDDQRRAIEARDANVLVAASAGTGKTAVLVERCIRLITDPERPIDIDRLLVVTFTEAAAAEMRNRIAGALRERVAADPTDARLRRQLILLDRASISTIHAFALRTLQEHFFRVGLDPNLSVLDPEEADLVRHETLDEVFEHLYAQDTPLGGRFRRLVGRYGRDGDDLPVRRVVLSLANFLQSLPRPDLWKASVLAAYPKGRDTRVFEDSAWYKPFRTALESDLDRLGADMRALADSRPDGNPLPADFVDPFHAVAEAFESFRSRLVSDGFDACQQAVSDYRLPDFPRKKSLDGDLRQQISARYSAVRKLFQDKVQKIGCGFSGEQWMETLRATRPDIETLFDLVDQFVDAYGKTKRERGALDFQDLERFCFELLGGDRTDTDGHGRTRTGGGLPSAAAREIRDRFEAVLVDEYQDISPIQDAILYLCSRQDEVDRPPNLFMVGDIKQSIYRFRLAEPRIFGEKFNRFQPDAPGAAEQRIDLRENFRSRGPLLDAVNEVFCLLMVPEVGGIRYDEDAALRGGFAYPSDAAPGLPSPGKGVPVEVHFFDRVRSGRSEDDGDPDAAAPTTAPDADAEEETEQIAIEARWVAERIRSMVEGREFSVWDTGERAYRPVAYRDVAVLLQTAVYKADLFVREFRARGVPAFTDAGSGFLLAMEIQDLFSLLEVLDNPRRDVSLAAVLRSPLVGLSEDDLARIRIHRRRNDFLSAVVAYAENGRKKELRKRLNAFLEQLDRWRTDVRRGPLAQALWFIYDETGYLDCVTAMPDGAQRRANLIGLYDRARQFDEFSRRGLGRFLEFIRQLQETEGELGAPPALSEAEDVVRVMSIHKSKGLEFPVVFIPDIGKGFNTESAEGDLVLDREYGIAVREVDPERAIKYPTAAYLVVAAQERREILAEGLRLLYVALTRARERLILCGSVRFDKVPNTWLQDASGGADGVPLDPVVIASAGCFADWIGPALARLGSLGDQQNKPSGARQSYQVRFHGEPDQRQYRLAAKASRKRKDRLQADMAAMKPIAATPEARRAVSPLLERLTWAYPWQALTEIRGKTSVSELKRRFEPGYEQDETEPRHVGELIARRPRFVTADAAARRAFTPAEVGTICHTVLRHLDLTVVSTELTVRRQVEMMVARGILALPEAEQVDLQRIARFLHSPLGLEMRRRAGRVLREVPFSLAIRADELEPGLKGKDPGDEWVHVQGIIDCLIERRSGYAVIDFKTDQVAPEEVPERAEQYRPQLQLYSRAVETIFRRPVVEKSLYFLHPGITYSLGGATVGPHDQDTEADF